MSVRWAIRCECRSARRAGDYLRQLAELGTPTVWRERRAKVRASWPATWSIWLDLVTMAWPAERWRRRRQRLGMWCAARVASF